MNSSSILKMWSAGWINNEAAEKLLLWAYLG